MNILSNFLAQGAQKSSKNQDVNNLAAKAGEQGMGQKFTQLMMGFLGINSADGSAESTNTRIPTGENIEQLSGKSSDTPNNENEALAGLFLGSHFVTVNAPKTQAHATADTTADQISGELTVNKTAALVLKELPATEENAEAVSAKTETKEAKATASDNQSAEQEAEKTEAKTSTENTEKTTNLTAGTELTDSKAAAEIQGAAVNGKEKTAPADQQNTEPPTKKPATKVQPAAKNGIPSSPTSETAPGKELGSKSASVLADDSQAKQKQDAKTSQASSAKSTDTQKRRNQKAAGQGRAAIHKRMDQAEGKIKLSEGKKAQTDAPQKMKADIKAHSSLKAELTQTAAGVTASGQDNASFKPLKQHSSTFELDPSKIVSVESGGSGDVEMELQTRSDGDTSAKDDGKGPINFGSSGLSQLHNPTGRREFSTQLVRQLQQSESGKGEAAKNWNHHRFVMDDGKTLNVSVRHTQEAMHLQLGAGDTRLNKFIQQHIDEIRQHLQEQLNVEINLELQHFGGRQAGQEKGNSQARAHRGEPLGIATGQAAANAHQAPVRTTRYLGFNTNEWTA